jgi:hypothetical protein
MVSTVMGAVFLLLVAAAARMKLATWKGKRDGCVVDGSTMH